MICWSYKGLHGPCGWGRIDFCHAVISPHGTWWPCGHAVAFSLYFWQFVYMFTNLFLQRANLLLGNELICYFGWCQSRALAMSPKLVFSGTSRRNMVAAWPHFHRMAAFSPHETPCSDVAASWTIVHISCRCGRKYRFPSGRHAVLAAWGKCHAVAHYWSYLATGHNLHHLSLTLAYHLLKISCAIYLF